MSGIKTYLTEEEWTGKSILVSPALMTPKKCWMMTGHFEVLKEQQFHLGRAMQSASRLGPPMPVTTMDDETLAPDNSVGSHIVIQAGHDWGVIGVPCLKSLPRCRSSASRWATSRGDGGDEGGDVTPPRPQRMRRPRGETARIARRR